LNATSVKKPNIKLFDFFTSIRYTPAMIKDYSSFIKSLRLENKSSQEEVAGKLGISRPSYIALEQGKRELSLAEANAFAKLFQISLEELMQGKKNGPVVVLEKRIVKKVEEQKFEKSSVRISVPQEKVEKFKKILLYILSKVGGKPNVGQTVLYKLLYFIDFDFYEKYEEQLIGAKYMRNTYGPSPVAFAKIVKELEQEGKLETIKSKFYTHDQTKYLVNPSEQIDLSGLSGTEIAHIDWELKRLSDLTANQLTNLSHKDTPWLVAKDKELLDYEYVFYRPEETSARTYEPL
jgi:transcriptional regulator with XRE-family HTH domain